MLNDPWAMASKAPTPQPNPLNPIPKRTGARPRTANAGGAGRSAALSDEFNVPNSPPHPWTSPMDSYNGLSPSIFSPFHFSVSLFCRPIRSRPFGRNVGLRPRCGEAANCRRAVADDPSPIPGTNSRYQFPVPIPRPTGAKTIYGKHAVAEPGMHQGTHDDGVGKTRMSGAGRIRLATGSGARQRARVMRNSVARNDSTIT